MNRVIGFAWILLSLPVIGLAAKAALLDLVERREAKTGRSWADA